MFTPTNKLTLKTALLFLGAIYFSGCSGAGDASFGSLGSSSSANSIPAGQSNGIVNPSLIFVGADSQNNEIIHVHKWVSAASSDETANFGNSCSIDPANPLQDIKCVMDVPEGELYRHGLNMIYNVPVGACRFLGRNTYWFYNYEVGYGPNSISITRTLTDGVVTAATCTVDGTSGPCDTTTFPEVVINADSSAPDIKCIYDQTTLSLPNGCIGSYNLSINDHLTYTSTSTPPSTVTTNSTAAWGTSITPIIGGAARTTAWPTYTAGTVSGFPAELVTTTDHGVQDTYQIPAPINYGILTNMEVANFYTASLHTHTGFAGVPHQGGPVPYPFYVDPVNDRNGSSIIPGNDSYEFKCYDQGFETLQRIRVYVREWDTYQDYVNYISSQGQVVVPDRSGAEGSASCTGIQGPCNDFSDNDDFVNFVGGYDTSAGNILNRGTFFPAFKFN